MSHLSLGGSKTTKLLLLDSLLQETFKPPLIIRLSLITASRVMIGMSHLSLGVNSSINFLIYYSLGSKFKDTIKRLTTCSRVEYPDSAKKEPADVSMFPRKKLCQDADLEVDNLIT